MDITAWLLARFIALTEDALGADSLTERYLLEVTITPIPAMPYTLNTTPYSRQVLVRQLELSSTLQNLRASSVQTSSNTPE